MLSWRAMLGRYWRHMFYSHKLNTGSQESDNILINIFKIRKLSNWDVSNTPRPARKEKNIIITNTLAVKQTQHNIHTALFQGYCTQCTTASMMHPSFNPLSLSLFLPFPLSPFLPASHSVSSRPFRRAVRTALAPFLLVLCCCFDVLVSSFVHVCAHVAQSGGTFFTVPCIWWAMRLTNSLRAVKIGFPNPSMRKTTKSSSLYLEIHFSNLKPLPYFDIPIPARPLTRHFHFPLNIPVSPQNQTPPRCSVRFIVVPL